MRNESAERGGVVTRKQRHAGEHDAGDPGRVRRGEVHGDAATERVADDDDRSRHLSKHGRQRMRRSRSLPRPPAVPAMRRSREGRSRPRRAPRAPSGSRPRSRRQPWSASTRGGPSRRRPRRSAHRRTPAARAARYASGRELLSMPCRSKDVDQSESRSAIAGSIAAGAETSIVVRQVSFQRGSSAWILSTGPTSARSSTIASGTAAIASALLPPR